MPFSFRRGVYIDSAKQPTADKAIELLPAPRFVTLPVTQHAGSPNSPLVAKGDSVALGQKIADGTSPLSAPVHASVAGQVYEVGLRPHPLGGEVMSVVLENDFSDRLDPNLSPIDADTLRSDEIIRRIREAGIVGHRGAPVPTHTKLSAAMGKAENLIINGSECEPYITSDSRIMHEFPWEVTGGAQILHRLLGVNRTIIAVGADKKSALAPLAEYLPRDGTMRTELVSVKYPQGSEKQLLRALFGKEIPRGRTPADMGFVVINADTSAAVYRLFATGMPMVRRIVTVAGGAVPNPKNLEVRIGTLAEHLFDACGGLKSAPGRLVMGGPMTGAAIESPLVPVLKSTAALLALSPGECHEKTRGACIRCGKCIDVCPMGLMPLYLYAAARKGETGDLKRFSVADCIECGACAYICPGGVPIVGAARSGKVRLAAEGQ